MLALGPAHLVFALVPAHLVLTLVPAHLVLALGPPRGLLARPQPQGAVPGGRAGGAGAPPGWTSFGGNRRPDVLRRGKWRPAGVEIGEAQERGIRRAPHQLPTGGGGKLKS
ncbi:hypothetical protein NN561_014071 [Cricetulus griseus]